MLTQTQLHPDAPHHPDGTSAPPPRPVLPITCVGRTSSLTFLSVDIGNTIEAISRWPQSASTVDHQAGIGLRLAPFRYYRCCAVCLRPRFLPEGVWHPTVRAASSRRSCARHSWRQVMPSVRRSLVWVPVGCMCTCGEHRCLDCHAAAIVAEQTMCCRAI